jgi:predicted membrane chloride channel (bestrophin family)
MDPRLQQRRRAKTPVFAIGQLEGKILGARPVDKAQALAAQYQAELPSRSITPYVEGDLPKLTRKTLRKIKCQMSLRDLVKDQSERPLSTLSSDADTLVGSASPTSQLSPTKGEFDHDEIALSDTHQNPYLMDDEADCSRSALDRNIGLKICVDLLTNELATALFRQHPAESEDRASGLQILLLIEAFEGIQRQARQRRHNSHLTEQIDDHYVEEVENILNHWLEVLYSVYDQSQENRSSKILPKDQGLIHNSIGNVPVVSTGNG